MPVHRSLRRARAALIGALVVLASSLATAPSATASTGTDETYIVLYSDTASSADAAAAVQAAGGSVVANYTQIGVVIAHSSSSGFAAAMAATSGVEGVSATANFATQLNDPQDSGADAAGPPPGDLPNSPATDTDTFSALQWNMRQIHTPEAHAITGGSPAVLVGDIDGGVDFNHPDLKRNLDVADSANCVSGAPVPGLAAQDDNGHGTHTAGIIAAAANGIGIVGVAPNVRLAAIKAADSHGDFFPQAVVCAFVWAADHHVDVTNNSYFADPFLFNCKNDPVQRAIWKAEQRAIRYAQTKGTVVVAAEGNNADDLAHPTQDVSSPDYPPHTAVTRTVHNDCVVIPVEIPGVVGVTADGHNQQPGGGYLKSFYSNYGDSVTQVVAPGGDSIFGRNAEAHNGGVLSTWPANVPCRSTVKEPTGDPSYPTAVYCYLQGTSMAAPHATGVAALIISRYGNLSSPQNGKMRPEQVVSLLEQTADPQPCPSSLPPGYAAFTSRSNGAPQTCTGGTGYNNWYGHGQINAL
ncbi:MAG TPA: S8 family serine peptidase, partial [Candidatus Dormibacteraeota bacterium]